MVESISMRPARARQSGMSVSKPAKMAGEVANILPIVDTQNKSQISSTLPYTRICPIVFPRESNPSILTCAKSKLNPDTFYTLTEAAELTGVSRNKLESWSRKRKNPRAPVLDVTMIDGLFMVSGRELLRVIDVSASAPENTHPLEDVARIIGRTYDGLKSSSLVWYEDERYYHYIRNSDGREVLIPVYGGLGGKSLVISDRDFSRVVGNFSNNRLDCTVAELYLASKGVDLEFASLENLYSRIKKQSDGSYFLSYVSPDCKVMSIPSLLLGRNEGGHAHTFHLHDLDHLIQVILEDQKRFIRYRRLTTNLGYSRKSHSMLSTKPRKFSLDGETRVIRLYNPGRCHILYILRSDAEFYAKWKEFQDRKNTEYVPVERAVCCSMTVAGRKAKLERFKQCLERRGSEILFPVTDFYGLAVRVRSTRVIGSNDEVLYVKNGHEHVLKFHMNITHPDKKVRTTAIRTLLREVHACAEPDLFLMYKLWTARSIYVTHPSEKEADENHPYDLDLLKESTVLLSDPKVINFFKRYSLDLVEDRVAKSNGDLRLIQSSDWDMLATLATGRFDSQLDTYAQPGPWRN